MIIMVFAPVSEEIREKVISYHLAGHGRNAIDRIMNEQGKTVSHSSISNIIARYRREQSSQAPQVDPSISKTIQIDNNVDPSPSSHGVELVNSDQEIDFADQEYETASEALLSNDLPYDPRLDGADGERLLGFEQGVDIEDAQNHNRVIEETSEVKEPAAPTENNQSQPRLSKSKDPPLAEDAEPELSLGIDWDAPNNYQTRFTKWVMEERRRRQVENKMLALHWKRLKEQRQLFEIRKKEFEEAEADLAQRIKDVKDLIPIAADLKQLGFDFSTANSWLICIKEMSQRKSLDIRSAAWKLVEDLKNWQELGGFETAISNAKHQLVQIGSMMTRETRKRSMTGSGSHSTL